MDGHWGSGGPEATMIIELELAAILACNLYTVHRAHTPRSFTNPPESEMVKVWRDGVGKQLYATRRSTDRDLKEFRNTPGFWLQYEDGRVEAGKQ